MSERLTAEEIKELRILQGWMNASGNIRRKACDSIEECENLRAECERLRAELAESLRLHAEMDEIDGHNTTEGVLLG